MQFRTINITHWAIGVLLFLLPFYGFSQDRGAISGTIQKELSGELVPYGMLVIKEINKTYHANEQGCFETERIPFGQYTIRFQCPDFQSKTLQITLDKKLVTLNCSLALENSIDTELDEVVVKNREESLDYIRRLRAIEGVMINQGKKNEVILVDGVNGNKATNSGRQIYAQIPGLNIWESDGAGIQLGIGGRGLDPSRTSNFNTRQNGYDISADALGYPESYYTPPSEAIKEIQIIRGAASLQFGTQFGGLLNFVMKNGRKGKKFEVTARQSVGSFGLLNSFLSVGGDHGRWNYYAFYQNKQGNDWRPNSKFKVHTGAFNVRMYASEKTSIRLEYTKMYYRAQQAGGLTDLQFELNPTVSFRDRNWFEVDWNLGALHIDHEFNSSTRLNSRFFGLYASRKALGFLDQITRTDPLEERDLIWGDFRNFGNETRVLHKYKINKQPWALLVGTRYYQGYNLSRQGLAPDGDAPDFEYLNPDNLEGSSYEFPSRNIALFAENICYVTNKFSITPGARFEYIRTEAKGSYREIVNDLAENMIFDTTYNDNRLNERSFLIGGIGLNYRFKSAFEVYANFSQNYRSINFTDMQIQNANFKIDPNLEDEKGFNIDLGLKGAVGNKLCYDISGFILSYANRIGTTIQVDPVWFNTYQYRTNISSSRTLGVEAVIGADVWKFVFSDTSDITVKPFVNASYIDARYTDSDEPAFLNKRVELVPPFSLKTGITVGYKSFSISYQFSYTMRHFSDASNSEHQANAVNGIIPSYAISDLSLKWSYKFLQIEAGVNNLLDERYFTRRATGYPGPGIIPSAPRNFYAVLQVQL